MSNKLLLQAHWKRVEVHPVTTVEPALTSTWTPSSVCAGMDTLELTVDRVCFSYLFSVQILQCFVLMALG